MSKLSFLFSLLRVPAILPFLPWVVGAGVLVSAGLLGNKWYKQASYKKEVKEERDEYQKCLKEAKDYKAIMACYNNYRINPH